MIIGLSGYAKSGKDTVAAMIQEYYAQSAGSGTTMTEWQIKKFSGKLKTIASILTGIPEFLFEDQEFKASELGPEWSNMFIGESLNTFIKPMTVREFLQRLGTDAIRDGLHANAWVNALMADYRKEEEVDKLSDYMSRVKPASKWIITDVRFPNEAQAIRDRGGIIIRIERPGIKPVNAHESETALDNWIFQHKILNASDLVSLRQSVEVVLNKLQWETQK